MQLHSSKPGQRTFRFFTCKKIQLESRKFYLNFKEEKCYIKINGVKICLKEEGMTKENLYREALVKLIREIKKELFDLVEKEIEDASWTAAGCGECYLQFRCYY